jgi:hypothetical protein
MQFTLIVGESHFNFESESCAFQMSLRQSNKKEYVFKIPLILYKYPKQKPSWEVAAAAAAAHIRLGLLDDAAVSLP